MWFLNSSGNCSLSGFLERSCSKLVLEMTQDVGSIKVRTAGIRCCSLFELFKLFALPTVQTTRTVERRTPNVWFTCSVDPAQDKDETIGHRKKWDRARNSKSFHGRDQRTGSELVWKVVVREPIHRTLDKILGCDSNQKNVQSRPQ